MKPIIVTKDRAKGVTFARGILKRIIEETGVDIRGNDRLRDGVFFRAVFFKVCEELTFLTLEQIADLCNRNHTQVIRSRRIFEEFKEGSKYLNLYYCLVLKINYAELTMKQVKETKARNKELESHLQEIKRVANADFFSIIDVKRKINQIISAIEK